MGDSDSSRIIGNLEGQVGFLREETREMRADLRGVRESQGRQTQQMEAITQSIKALSDKLDDMGSGDDHPGHTPRDTGTDRHARPNESTVLVILRHPATPIAFCCTLLVVALIVVVSALTGRDANTLIPSRSLKTWPPDTHLPPSSLSSSSPGADGP
jgi:hypothetical protein